MIANTDNFIFHYCKHCDSNFAIKIHEFVDTGDFFLVCPYCEYEHYRFFKDGIATHCDIDKRTSDKITRIVGRLGRL